MAAQILILPIMARYLSPEDFGVIALAMVFVTISMTLSDAGIGSSLVRTQTNNPSIWSSAFWLILGIGGLFSLLLVLLAPWVSSWFNNPKVAPLIYALAPIPLIQSSIAVHLARLQKKGEMGLISVAEITATAISFAAAVVVAISGGGAWALVVQQLVLWIIKAGVIALKSDLKVEFRFSFSPLKEHLLFGRDVITEALVRQASNQSSNLVIGKALGNGSLGIFSMAFRFVTLPVQIVSGPVVYVLYGHMAKYQDNHSAIRAMFLGATRLVAILVIPPVAVVAAASDAFFTLFLSPKWSEVASAFSLMAPASAFMAVTILTQAVVLTTGVTRLRLRLSIEMTVYWLFLLVVTAQWGVVYVAAAFSLWYFTYLPRLLTAILGVIQCSLGAYLRIFSVPVFVSIFFFIAHRVLVDEFTPSAVLELSLMVPELIVVWSIVLFVSRSRLRYTIVKLKCLTQGLKRHPDLKPTISHA